MRADEHSLSIVAELDEIHTSSAWAAGVAETLDLPSSLAFALDVCLEEALANVINHGLKCAPSEDRQIRLTIGKSACELHLVIEDRGVPFDPSEVEPPEAPTDLEEARIGGLGVSLMQKLASAMRYHRRDGVNTLTLDFALG